MHFTIPVIPGLTAYGYAFYCIVARDEAGRGTPLVYFITSEDTEAIIALCLTKIKEAAQDRGKPFSPRYAITVIL